jgi:RNA polymerase sigma-70 factor (ECF subfamily)
MTTFAAPFSGEVLETPAAENPDRALLARIARGDQQAMEHFHRRHSGRVHRFALARVDDPLEADAITNDVMMKVWDEAGAYRGTSSVTTWVLGIAYHRAMDSLRSRYRHAAAPLDEGLVDDAAVDMTALMETVQDARRVQAALARLDPQYRTVLHLAFFEDLPYEQIAKILGCPEGTVKSRVFHGKQLLKRYLSQRH